MSQLELRGKHTKTFAKRFLSFPAALLAFSYSVSKHTRRCRGLEVQPLKKKGVKVLIFILPWSSISVWGGDLKSSLSLADPVIVCIIKLLTAVLLTYMSLLSTNEGRLDFFKHQKKGVTRKRL